MPAAGPGGKAGIVVGAASGIGSSVTALLHAQGARLALLDIDEQALSGLADTLPETSRVVPVVADVASRPAMLEAVKTAFDALGRIDFLCHVAGIYPSASLDGMTEAFWDRTVDVNLKGVFLSVQACLPYMRDQRSGKIAVVSSVTGPRVALKGLSAYAAAKAGVCGFVRAAALELAPFGITINAVLPGTIATPGLFRQLGGDEALDAVAGETPLGRMGRPEDIADVLIFLLSDAANFITGQEIVVDGGSIIQE